MPPAFDDLVNMTNMFIIGQTNTFRGEAEGGLQTRPYEGDGAAMGVGGNGVVRESAGNVGDRLRSLGFARDDRKGARYDRRGARDD